MITKIILIDSILYIDNSSNPEFKDSIKLNKGDLIKLQSIQQRYQDRPKNETNQKTLRALGQELYEWLNQSNCINTIIKAMPTPPWNVEFLLEEFPENELQKTFINLPWEIIADEKGFLAKRRGLSYNPYRRIYKEPKNIAKISEARLSLMFMAASPEGVNQLDYEAEEMAILEATGGLEQNKLDLYVEESGNLKQLADELQRIKHCDILHLSCHGTADNPPSLLMENSYGEKDLQNVDKLFEALQNVKPSCLVLSAWNTADANTDVLCLSLIQSGFQSVIGMAGAVSDKDAIAFTANLYKQLSESASLQNAMGNTRYTLLNDENPTLDWHLPRLYLNTNGGGVLCNGTKSHLGNQRYKKQSDFMGDKDNPVASDQEYVGRRRQIQHTLGAWRKGNCAGVMLKGMGRQGKSSTALRLSSRSYHHAMVVLYKHYDTKTLLRKLNEVGRQDVTDIIEKYKEQASDNPQVLTNCLVELLQGPFAIADDDNQSLLLVIDDLETILKPQKGQKHQVDDLKLEQTLQAIIQSFNQSTSDARLLITSRYEFTLKAHNKDYADYLHIEHMPTMSEAESRKQCRKRQKRNGESENTLDWSLEHACIQAAKGNPGLQDWLFNLAFSSPEQCLKAVEQIKAYQGSGKPVDDEALNTWIENLVLTELIEQLEQGSRTLLSALTLFEIPVPESMLQTLCNEMGISGNQWEQVLALGLCDAYPQSKHHDVMIHPLIRHFFDKNTEQDNQALIKICLPQLWTHWKNSPTYPQSAQLLALAVQIENLEIIKACAEDGLYYLKRIKGNLTVAEPLAIKALKLTQQQNSKLPSEALRWIGEILTGTEHQKEAMQCYKTALEQAKEEKLDDYSLNSIRFSYARLLTQNGDIEGALDQLEKARKVLKIQKRERELATVNGEIARIRVSKGDVDGALKLHEERKAVFEGLGDQRERAVTLGDIARIRVSKGDVDGALKLHEEMLAVFEGLGDQRSRAVTLGDIARIRVSKGDVDGALKLHKEELEVYEGLGDQRSRAVTLGDLARIRVSKGDVDGALKLHEEMLAVFEGLGDQRSRAVTLGEIARIRVSKGDVDGALKLHEERKAVFEGLGDQRSRAVTLRDIARIRVSKGDIEGALRYQQECLAVARSMGDMENIGGTQFDIAQIKLQQEDIDSALECLAESWQIFNQIGRADGIVAVGNFFGQLLCAIKQIDDAQEVLAKTREVLVFLNRDGEVEALDEIIAGCGKE